MFYQRMCLRTCCTGRNSSKVYASPTPQQLPWPVCLDRRNTLRHLCTCYIPAARKGVTKQILCNDLQLPQPVPWKMQHLASSAQFHVCRHEWRHQAYRSQSRAVTCHLFHAGPTRRQLAAPEAAAVALQRGPVRLHARGRARRVCGRWMACPSP